MGKYDPNEFIQSLNKHVNGKPFPRCQFCGGNKFTSTDSMATILISTEKTNINLGPLVPAGMVICENCGHIDFFALGPLGIANDEGGEVNAN